MNFIVDLQGFKAPQNEFILKEISIIQADEKKSEPITLFFKSPYVWNTLPPQCKTTNKWLERNFHGISWDYGGIPYDAAKIIISCILQRARAIYVKGHEKASWLLNFLEIPREIIDMDTLGCPPVRKLPKVRLNCSHHHHNRPDRNLEYSCANENVKSLRIWLYVYRALCDRGIFK